MSMCPASGPSRIRSWVARKCVGGSANSRRRGCVGPPAPMMPSTRHYWPRSPPPHRIRTSDMSDDFGRARLAEGAAAYQRGDVGEARRLFEEIARTSTAGLRISALVNAASMCDELGDHAEAIVMFRAALAEMPDDAIDKRTAALINLSQALQHVGDLDGAQQALEQARALLTEHNDESMQRVACLLSLTAVAFHRQNWAYAIELATESLNAAVRFAPPLAG